jgi:hypothetical protein
MTESQIAQLAAAIPPSDEGKILGQLKDLDNQKHVCARDYRYCHA